MKKLILALTSPFLGKRFMQPFFEKMHLYSLYGMNYARTDTLTGSGEVHLMERISKRLRGVAKPVIFDVGANVGKYSLELAKRFPAPAVIYAFEPYPPTFAQLKQNTVNVKNLILENSGLGDASGELEFFFTDSNSAFGSLLPRDMSHWNETLSLKNTGTKVNVTTLDEYCRQKGISRIDFLKVDVEGYEIKLFEGAASMLKNRAIAMIQFEMGVCAVDGKYFLKDIFGLLGEGYHIFRIVRNGIHPILKYHERHEVFMTGNYFAILKSEPPL